MRRKVRGVLLALALIMSLSSVLLFTSCNGKTDDKSDDDPKSFAETYSMQRFKQSDVVYAVRNNIQGLAKRTMSIGEKLLLQSVQGIVSQRQAELFIGNSRDKFLTHAKKSYNLTIDDGRRVYYMENGEEATKDSETEWLNSLEGIIRHYIETGDIKGYVKIRYKNGALDQQESQVNQGCTLSGLNQWIIVPENLEEVIKEKFPDLTLGFDLSTTDLSEYDVIKENIDKLNKDVLIMQAPNRVENLREYGIAAKAPFYFYNPSTPYDEKHFVYSNLNMLANAFGWQQIDTEINGVRYGVSEIESVDFASQRDVNVIAADWCTNLSFWSSLPTEQFKQKETRRISTDDENVHYLTFLYSDGDNIQWLQGGGFANDFYLRVPPEKKTMPFGWTVTPNIVETVPSMLKYLYENMTDIEHFVVSVSGYAYNHPALMSEEAMRYNCEITDRMMKQADMKYVAMKGINSRVMRAYAEQPNFEGGFVMYGKDEGRPGHIYWYNDKPFVHDRVILWKDRGDWADPTYVAKNLTKINYFSTDKTQTAAYTFVQVHCWSYQYQDLQNAFTKYLDESVKIVPPNEFIDLIKDNIEHPNNQWTIPR